MKSVRLPVIPKQLYRNASTNNVSHPRFVNVAKSGKLNFEKDFEKSHVKTNLFQKLLLGIGSGVISITAPSRGDMIAVMGEVTGYQAWKYVHSKMQQSAEGRQILEEKPRISSGSVDLEKLKLYPEGTLGKAYSNFLTKYGYSPDSRNAVQFVDNIELAYVAQRYREAHDLFHTLLNMPTNMLGEVTVKWVEAIQLKLPMCATGALFGAVRLAPKSTRTYCTRSIIKIDKEVAEKIEQNIIKPKNHPGIMHMPCVEFPDVIQRAITSILHGQNRKLMKQRAQELKMYLDKRPLPLELSEVERDRKYLYKQMRRKYGLPEDELPNSVEKEIEGILRSRHYHNLYKWEQIKYDKFKSLQFLISRAPGEFAAVKRVLSEIYKRDPTFAPRTLLDFGSGVGTVNWAAYGYWGNTLKEYYCIDTSYDMHELAGLLLTNNDMMDEPFIKNIYYRVHIPNLATPYNVVVSAFSLLELRERKHRIKVITKLWNITEDYLVVIENGNECGFAAITEVRDYLIEMNKEYKVDYHIFAPCPHELDCPRLTFGIGQPICNFSMKYTHLRLYKKGAVGIQNFSYVIFKKGEKPAIEKRFNRLVRDVKKSKKLAHCFMCTTKGEYKIVPVTESKHGKLAYKVMKKSSWGDLVPGVLEEVPKITGREEKMLTDDSTESHSEDNYNNDYGDSDCEEGADECKKVIDVNNDENKEHK